MANPRTQGWNGYRQVRRGGKFVYTHRWVMEQALGRPLLPTEHVHHINGDKKDNRLENLQVIPAGEHTRLHQTGKPLKPETRERILALKAQGLRVGEIAREVGLHQSTVTRHIQRSQGICGRDRLPKKEAGHGN